jgi:hypothetical protein
MILEIRTIIARPPKIDPNIIGSEDSELCDVFVEFILFSVILITVKTGILDRKNEIVLMQEKD